MFLYKVYVADSKIDGKGLFAGEFIPEGAIIWRHCDNTVKIFTDDEWRKMLDAAPLEKKEELLKYGYKSRNFWFLHLDEMKYTNHSDAPTALTNTRELVEKKLGFEQSYTFAARDILPGEELTENYKIYFDADIWKCHNLS